MNKVNLNELQSQKIKRTICIGLGGSGKDVLMRIRRSIVDRYKDLTELPVVSFVHIDTDKSASNVSGLRTGNTYHGVDLSFRDAEKVAATMTRMEVNNFVQELNRRSSNYEGSPGVYKHIECWFPPQLLKDLKAIDEGAKGIRPVGRLAFFHNYRSIKNAIEAAEKRTRGHEASLIRKGLQVENQLNIFVVGSLCGGTGSGIFLDVAYCLRRNYGDRGAQIFGYLIVSPELYGNNPSMNANTYAALKELNYYATYGTRFDACYDQQNLEYVQESRPPFEYVYLIANRTAGDYKILEKSKLCNIIAHKITLDFASELAPVITAQRDNFLQHMIRSDEHPRPNVQRYLTFGLAEIYFPRDVAVQISLNRIKIKLIKFWLEGEGQSPDIQVLLERFLRSWYPEQGKKDGFLSKLQEATIDGSKTFSNAIANWRNRLENEIVECKTTEERQIIISQLSKNIREQFRKVQPGETESSRGVWLTNLEQVRWRFTEQFKQDIERCFAELLNPNSSDFAIASSRAWLEALTTELNKYHRDLEDKLSAMGQVHRLEDLEKKWKDSEQIINDIEQKRSLSLFNKQKNSQFQEEAKRAISQVSTLLKHNFDFALTQQALQLVQALQQHVKDLITQASHFYNLVKNLQTAYEKIEQDLKQLNVDEMSGEAIFAEADTDDCYQDLLPDRDRTSQLALVSSKITERVGMEDSLASCLDKNLIDEQQLQELIDLIVDGLFGSRSHSTVQSAVRRFLENYSLSDRAIRLEQIIREAKPLLPLNTSDPYFYNDPGKSLDLIGFKDTDTREVAQFKSILFNDLGIPDSHLKPIQAEDEIVMVSEYAGFPLRIVDGVEQMRQHYLREKNYGNAFLHNDYRTPFTDIIPPDAGEMKQLQDLFYPALAFNLLPYNSQTGMYQFEYYDRLRDTHEITSLSYIWDEALEQLANFKDLIEALRKELDGAILDISHHPHRWEEHYLPKLREFVAKVDDLPEEDANYPYKEIVVGTRATIDIAAKEGIINRFWRRMQEIYQQHQQQKQLQASPQSSSVIHKSLMGTNVRDKSSSQQPQHHNDLVMDTDFTDSDSARFSLDKEDIEAKLRKLIQLKEKGLISEESYKAKEREYLDFL
ncbi:hypothetical protein IQ238_23340 [Pleurocapsales cyanobacterium LEGE 06147]|nr:hypothetical protein [Pleurocapsales cyanobacterium LEGE 06147]